MRALAVLGLVFLLGGPASARTPAECMERNNGYYAARAICSTVELREIDFWLYRTIQKSIRRGVGHKQEEFKRRIDQSWFRSAKKRARHLNIFVDDHGGRHIRAAQQFKRRAA